MWRFSQSSQFRSGFVLVWFVEHVVYGEGLYFLEFDELQIKQDQMNGPVRRGYTCAVLWFSVSVNLSVHTHTPMTIHGCMNTLILSFTDTHHLVCPRRSTRHEPYF